MHEMPGAGQEVEPMRGGVSTVSTLRRAYFAHAAELAIRYDVVFDRVLEHVRDAQERHPHLSLQNIEHIDDLIHAVACVDGAELAWWDLVERHERALVRACRQWLDETDAIVFVRRLLAQLRHDDDRRIPSLRSFDGTCSMRRWLGDRLVGVLTRPGVGLITAPRKDVGWRPVILWTVRGNRDEPPTGRCLRGEYAWPAPLGRPGPTVWGYDQSTGSSG